MAYSCTAAAIWKYAVGWGVLFLVVASVRGIHPAGLPAIHAHPRHRVLVGGVAAFDACLGFPTAPTPAKRRWGYLRPRPSAWSSASASGTQDRSGGRSAATPAGTGQSRISMGPQTAASYHKATCSVNIQPAPRCGAAATTGPEGSLLVLALLADHGAAHVAVVGTPSAVPFQRQRLETGLE